MVAHPRLSHVSPLVPPVGAALAGALVAVVFAIMPTVTLEDVVWRSGVAALVPAAAPPLGTTARAVLALAGGAMAAMVTWSILYLLVGPGGLIAPRGRVRGDDWRGVPIVRRADAHPDAPPRPPMTAADLGTPLMEFAPPAPVRPPMTRPVPTDLDLPLSAFDPAAIPAVPMPPPVRVAPLKPPSPPALAPGERIDTYVLTPPVPTPPVPTPPAPTRPPPEPAVVATAPPLPVEERPAPLPIRREPVSAAAAPSIDMLLRRLEEGAALRLRGTE